MVKCPYCKQKLLQKSGSTTKLRTHGPILFGEDGTARSKCFWCKREVEVPVQVREGTPVSEERFLLPQG